MKVPNQWDFLVYAESLPWAVAFENSELLQGGYVVGLNSRIEIRFVSDVSCVAPPWDNPDIVDDSIASAADARVWALRTSEYSVTPNDVLHGSEEVVPLLHGESSDPDADPQNGVVWYVSEEEWGCLASELEDLVCNTSPLGEFVNFSDLSETNLSHFIVERFLASSLLSSHTVDVLRRAGYEK
ncbi:hypothetical protein [Nocardia sp. CC227C]|uniref:hypothetical protein n=1 Tax=Nocardia sp. CC227C TaxID=3044562 RepID=UPI00278C2FDD|nr:hypothetical protein [Nocardia sp. CC227C]